MVNSIILIYIFIVGACIGSFLNVCIFRIPHNESIISPPSHCGSCGTALKPLDLIPIVSYLFLGGKCRYCKSKLSIQYPLIEFLTGILLAAVYLQYGLNFLFFKYSVLIIFLLLIGMIDLFTTDVYFSTTAAGILAGIAFVIYGYFTGNSIGTFIYGAALGGGTIAVIVLLTKGMGLGDIEICLLSGLFLGFKLTLFMLFISFFAGGIIGILLIVLKIKSRKDFIPFGPFVALGSIITIFLGEKIIEWYLFLF